MKTICIYHSVDLDGWMSAAIVKHWFNHTPISPEEKDDTLDFLGWNYGDEIPDLSEYDKVIMCDISFPKEEMDKLFDSLSTNFIWIDHHISAIKANDTELITGIQNTEYAACELTWEYFFPNKTIPEIVRLLGRYDCFGHKDTDEEQKVLGFQYGARQKISSYKEAYEWLTMCLDHSEIVNEIQNAGDEIYDYLCTEAKQTYKKGFEAEFKIEAYLTGATPNGYNMTTNSDPIEDVSKHYRFICFNKERFNPVNFGIDYHKDEYDGVACFWYQDGQWAFSLYNDNGKVDCSVIAKQYGGGGHKGASGFKVNNIEEFLKSHKI